MRKIAITVLALAAAACGPDAQELATIAQRDSLLAEVLERATLINEISTELGKVADTTTGLALPTEEGLTQAAAENEVVLGKIRHVISRLELQEEQLQESRDRIRSLTTQDSRLSEQIDRYEATVNEIRAAAESREAEYTALVDQQRSMIASLSRQLDTAYAQNRELAAENQELETNLSDVTAAANTVYYIAGTKDELKEKGIVVEEGSKFLFFGSRTLQPARDLDPEQFFAIDKTAVFEIPLPDQTKPYRILSRHNPMYLANAVDDGEIRESVAIDSPEKFWEPSRFLILVQN